jgi:predicted dehydrogenase
MLNGVLIGMGNIALRGHAPAFLSPECSTECRIVAVMDIAEQNRVRARELFPAARFYTDIGPLLEKEKPDFVDICTPPHTHAEYIRTAAERGIHILCEKPLAERFSAVGEIAGVLAGRPLVFVPCHQYKYSPLWKSVREVIASGMLGDVTVAQFNVYRLQADSGTAAWKPEWRVSKDTSGGGILVDTGAHYFYLAQSFFGLPLSVSAVLRTLKHTEYAVEDTALVTLVYPRAVMQVNLTWASSTRANSAFVAGTRGTLTYDGRTLLHASADTTRELPMPDVSDKSQYIGWYVSLFREFFRRVKENDFSRDLVDESVNVMKLLEASYRSSEEHRMVALR